MNSLRVQLNHIDYNLAAPGPLDGPTDLPLVPIIRIFGPSSTGQKACVNIHQIFPYFFVDYPGNLAPSSVRRYIRKLIKSLNHAIALSLKRDPHAGKFIRAIILIKGIPFYGFHASYSPFLKIYVANPALVNRAVAICMSGSVMSTRFRVFESHIGLVLQFLSDFGLYGCGAIDLCNVLQRGNNAEDEEFQFPPSTYFRQSRMELEVDVEAHNILNRNQLTARNLHHKLEITESQPLEPLVLSVRELWDDERSRRVVRGLNPSPEMPVDPSESSRGPGGDWVSEVRWWDSIRARIEAEKGLEPPPRDVTWENFVMTAFESVQGIWDKSKRTWKPGSVEEPAVELDINEPDDIDVDETLLSTQAVILFEEQEDRDKKLTKRNELYEDDEQRKSEDEDFYYDDPLPQDISDDELSTTGQRPQETDPFLDTSGAELEEFKLATQAESPLDSPCSEDPSPPDVSHREPVVSIPLRENPEEQVSIMSSNPKPKILKASFTPTTSSERGRTTIGSNLYSYTVAPPTSAALLASMDTYNIPTKIYRAAHYSCDDDAPLLPREIAGLVYHLKGGDGVENLEDWIPESLDDLDHERDPDYEEDWEGFYGWEYADLPPNQKTVKKWLLSDAGKRRNEESKARSQLAGVTQANIYGIKASLPEVSSVRERQEMTIFSLELFAPSANGLLPDPGNDEIAAVFYSFQQGADTCFSGILALDVAQLNQRRLKGVQLELVLTELDIINGIIDIIVDLDPDILSAWDTQWSWEYLNCRGSSYGLDVEDLISRASSPYKRSNERWEKKKNSIFRVTGRHVLNVWRVMRSELTLSMYTFENVVFQCLRQRVPKYSPATLTRWFNSETTAHVVLLLRYFVTKTSMVLKLLDATELVTKTAEFARVFGVDFYSVITRGSQYKVESFMFRIAKPESFLLISPSKADVGRQNAAECMPLIMEPKSAFYTSPLVVLDFQSLYPSVMIAYNYCYSTCLGRVAEFQGRYKFGVTSELNIPPGVLEKLEDNISVAPNGIMFVKPEVRRGLLGRMLSELLDTRVMVKQAMKGTNDKTLRKILNARQLGLKYIANVTYGYTGATFSGRMPAVEIADSIVQTGRETLEKAIVTINSTEKWGAEVVYGDTDSVFIYLRGKTKEQAFRIGHEIADTITAQNPAPIKLKFEKVYLPCVLMAKKRYVGHAYESIDDLEPIFDAKGIETVRRDGIKAQQIMTEATLKMLFRSQDLSEIKSYCCRSWMQLLENKLSPQSFVFAREVRMGTYSDKGPPPPGVAVATRRTALDPSDEAQYGERIPYVIVRGLPGLRLVERAMDPGEMLANTSLSLDAEYYISRVLIPPLERILSLVGADVRQWYNDMAKPKHLVISSPSKEEQELPASPDGLNIHEHFGASECLICVEPAEDGLCFECRMKDRDATIAVVMDHIRIHEKRLLDTQLVCATCTGAPNADPVECISLDCDWYYRRARAVAKTDFLVTLMHIIKDLETDRREGIPYEEAVSESERLEDMEEEEDYWEVVSSDDSARSSVEPV
ncbi:hypothetical protein C8J56DRAFT_919017 [Mycena floridula]|nr:hypothetical protein C8J56DRAFT_919017 [Mycena floridula]